MTGYCKYCDSLINEDETIRAINSDTHQVIWVGCRTCYEKRIESM